MKMITKYTFLVLNLIIVSIMLSGCNASNESINSSSENFDEFYNKFHSDSLFQLSRVKFPLGGKSIQGVDQSEWTKDNWQMMKAKIYDVDTSEYKVFYKKTENEFIQKIWIEDSGFNLEYRFELIDNKWFLVYTLDQNI
ncbi:MAG: DUF4348 domain-containing protein [Bacteroidetes bacterium]|nr:DUF4348 domain-containing protein [Bacteroidota bacterium]MBU1117182.1 DUF4348 domain-containing protein [Bacteroidota bacterium]MBU1798546.1 DUF4348 domain-containing protein [Bacteroidota bacterium]